MTTNGSRTAAVETLTAEVRTLQVGSRQVTMSVFNQLDTVCFDAILDQPFGRVRPREQRSHDLHIVGAHVLTGALVRSRIVNPENIKAWANKYKYESSPFDSPHEVVQRKPGQHLYPRPSWLMDDNTWPADIDWTEAAQIWEYFNTLPLIVLAGLR